MGRKLGADSALHGGCSEEDQEHESFLCYFCRNLPSGKVIVSRETVTASNMKGIPNKRNLVYCFDTFQLEGDDYLFERTPTAEIRGDKVYIFNTAYNKAHRELFEKHLRTVISAFEKATGRKVEVFQASLK